MSDPKPTFNQAGARVHHAEARTYGHELLAALRKQFDEVVTSGSFVVYVRPE